MSSGQALSLSGVLNSVFFFYCSEGLGSLKTSQVREVSKPQYLLQSEQHEFISFMDFWFRGKKGTFCVHVCVCVI